MSQNSIQQIEQIVKWKASIDPTTDLTGIPDGIYPFDYLGTDKWAIVISEKQIAWGRDYGIICTIYVEALRVKREHVERCPSDAIPFNGEPVVYESVADGYAIEPVAL